MSTRFRHRPSRTHRESPSSCARWPQLDAGLPDIYDPKVYSAARGAQVVQLVASGEPEKTAYVTRDVYEHIRRTRVPETEVYDMFATAISELEVRRHRNTVLLTGVEPLPTGRSSCSLEPPEDHVHI